MDDRARARRDRPRAARGSTLAPPEPRRTTQISPGIRRIRTNTSAAAPNSVGTTSSTRFTIYRYILYFRSWSRRRAPQRMRTGLLIEPHVGQVLIDVVARADLPALHIGAQRHDPIPVRSSPARAPAYRARASRTRASARAASRRRSRAASSGTDRSPVDRRSSRSSR